MTPNRKIGKFLGEMQTYDSCGRTKKLFLLLPGCFGLRAVGGIFWPGNGGRPSEGQRNPENSPKAKTSLAKAKQDFLFFQMMKNVVH